MKILTIILKVLVFVCLASFIFLPILVLGFLGFTQDWTQIFNPSFTVEWFLSVPQIFSKAILYSLILAFITMCLTLVVSSLVAYLILREKITRFSGVIDVLIMLPLTIPQIVLGLAFMITFNQPPLRLYGTFGILILGHFVVTMPYAFRNIRSTMENFDFSILEAAICLGASEPIALRRVILPAIAPSLLASSLFSFVFSLANFPMTYIIAPAGIRTIPLVLFGYIESEIGGANYRLAGCLSLYLIGLVILLSMVVRKLTGRNFVE